MIYGIKSAESFGAYQADKVLQQQFAEQRKDFAHQLRIERFAGKVAISVDS